MKEYNWRKEREKYQPDFNKRPQEPEQIPVPAAPAPERPLPWKKIVVIAAAVLAVILIIWRISSSSTNVSSPNLPVQTEVRGNTNTPAADSASALAGIAEKYKSAVGLVVCQLELSNGEKITVPVGTAWGIAENKFATNAHVAMGVKAVPLQLFEAAKKIVVDKILKDQGVKSMEELKQKLGEDTYRKIEQTINEETAKLFVSVNASVIINGGGGKSFNITHVQIHSQYGDKNSTFDPDFAILTVQGTLDSYFQLAGTEKLSALKSGKPVAFLGYPMEMLQNDNVNTANPVASMQSGIIVAVSDFEYRDAGAGGNYLIRHNLPCTGGASGSPLFDTDGQVIGIVTAINVIGQVVKSDKGPSVERAPSAAQINFAIRIDLINGMSNPVSLQDFMSM